MPIGSAGIYTAEDQWNDLIGVAPEPAPEPAPEQAPPPAEQYPVTDSQGYAAESAPTEAAPIEGGVVYDQAPDPNAGVSQYYGGEGGQTGYVGNSQEVATYYPASGDPASYSAVEPAPVEGGASQYYGGEVAPAGVSETPAYQPAATEAYTNPDYVATTYPASGAPVTDIRSISTGATGQAENYDDTSMYYSTTESVPTGEGASQYYGSPMPAGAVNPNEVPHIQTSFPATGQAPARVDIRPIDREQYLTESEGRRARLAEARGDPVVQPIDIQGGVAYHGGDAGAAASNAVNWIGDRLDRGWGGGARNAPPVLPTYNDPPASEEERIRRDEAAAALTSTEPSLSRDAAGRLVQDVGAGLSDAWARMSGGAAAAAPAPVEQPADLDSPGRYYSEVGRGQFMLPRRAPIVEGDAEPYITKLPNVGQNEPGLEDYYDPGPGFGPETQAALGKVAETAGSYTDPGPGLGDRTMEFLQGLFGDVDLNTDLGWGLGEGTQAEAEAVAESIGLNPEDFYTARDTVGELLPDMPWEDQGTGRTRTPDSAPPTAEKPNKWLTPSGTVADSRGSAGDVEGEVQPIIRVAIREDGLPEYDEVLASESSFTNAADKVNNGLIAANNLTEEEVGRLVEAGVWKLDPKLLIGKSGLIPYEWAPIIEGQEVSDAPESQVPGGGYVAPDSELAKMVAKEAGTDTDTATKVINAANKVNETSGGTVTGGTGKSTGSTNTANTGGGRTYYNSNNGTYRRSSSGSGGRRSYDYGGGDSVPSGFGDSDSGGGAFSNPIFARFLETVGRSNPDWLASIFEMGSGGFDSGRTTNSRYSRSRKSGRKSRSSFRGSRTGRTRTRDRS